MTSLFSYLHRSLKVTPTDNKEELQVTVTLPSDLVLHYVRVLDSLTGFARTINSKAKLAKLKDSDFEKHLEEQGRIAKENYYKRIVEEYDIYTADGLTRYEAIKKISAGLRAENHQWSSPDLVRPSLVEAGRGGRPGRPRRKQS